MKTTQQIAKRTTLLGFLLLQALGLCACAASLGSDTTNWKEEVLLHDGSRITVARTIERGGRHEIGQQPPVKEESVNFKLPRTGESVTWKSDYSQDVGVADFMPLLLDIDRGVAYVVSVPVGCLSYNKWGRPNPPYVIFKYHDKAWKRISLQELPDAIKMPNLIFSSPDNKVEQIGRSFVTAEDVKKINSSLTQPEYKTIRRDALPVAGQGCEVLINYKGYWIMPNDPVARAMVDGKTK